MDREPVSEEKALEILGDRFARGQQGTILVTGTSMVPFLRHEKDMVRLSPVTDLPEPGDICLFTLGGRLLLHRMRKQKDGQLYMNGDGRMEYEVIHREQLVAVVTHIIRRSGRVIDCGSLWFRVLSALWQGAKPIRPALLRMAEQCKHSGRKGRSQ